MIQALKGFVWKTLPTGVILNVHNRGYALSLTPSDIGKLPKAPDEVELWVYLKMREDDISLYGFIEWTSRELFALLNKINGVGPKVALAILATLSFEELSVAIQENRVELLQAVPGIGKKTAERILVDLKGRDNIQALLFSSSNQTNKGKVVPWDFGQPNPAKIDQIWVDARSALVNLGFKDKDIASIMKKHKHDWAELDFSTIVKKALKLLTAVQNRQVSEHWDGQGLF